MDNKKYKLIFVLLVINKGVPLNDSYTLTRIIEWKLRTIESKELLDEIKANNYVDFELINKIYFYKITRTGIELIKREYDKTLEYLVENYPEEKEFISNIFNTSHINKQ